MQKKYLSLLAAVKDELAVTHDAGDHSVLNHLLIALEAMQLLSRLYLTMSDPHTPLDTLGSLRILLEIKSRLATAALVSDSLLLKTLHLHVASLFAPLQADACANEFNFKDAAVCLHEARRSVKEWQDVLTEWQRDMSIPLTTQIPLSDPSYSHPESSTASAHLEISPLNAIRALFGKSKPTRVSRRDPTQGFHVSSWVSSFIDAVAEKFAIVFQAVLAPSSGVESVREWNLKRIQDRGDGFEALCHNLVSNHPSILNISLIHPVSQDAPHFWIDGFHFLSSHKYTQPQGLATYPPVFSFPDVAPIVQHWPNLISLLQSTPSHISNTPTASQTVSQVLKRTDAPPPPSEPVSNPADLHTTNISTTATDSHPPTEPEPMATTTSVPNVGVFGSVMGVLRKGSAGLYGSRGNGAAGEVAVSEDVASPLSTAAESWSGPAGARRRSSAASRVSFSHGVWGEEKRPVGGGGVEVGSVEWVQRHMVWFYDRKVDYTYVIVRVSAALVGVVVWKGKVRCTGGSSQEEEDVGGDGGECGEAKDVVEFWRMGVRKLGYLGLKELI
ncbi:hypothetical protein HDU98_000430 [Podochytrium sp. JEL0797]|nr:hypothetical protein HDU98_000430 [Podochytrium sp. JEL0797]